MSPVLELHQSVRVWAEASLAQPPGSAISERGANLGYIDLLFAFALARRGEADPARRLVESARQVLHRLDPTEDRGIVARFLFEAFQYRVEQARAGQPHAGPLPQHLRDELEQILAKAGGHIPTPHGVAYYAINRMREQSRILEPQEMLDPYTQWARHSSDLAGALADLPRERDPRSLAERVRKLYRDGADGKATPETRCRVLFVAIPLAARVGEEFAVELIGLVPETMKWRTAVGMSLSELARRQGQLLERALFVAAHFGRREVVQQLADQFVELVRAEPEEQRYELVNVVAGECLRSLRELGLRDEIVELLRRLQEVVFGGQTAEQVRARCRSEDPRRSGWATALRSLLNLAGGWLELGLTGQAAAILDDARAELLGPGAGRLPANDYTALARAYIAAVGRSPADDASGRIAELFRAMDPTRVTNSFATSKFYSRFHLNLTEEAALAVTPASQGTPGKG